MIAHQPWPSAPTNGTPPSWNEAAKVMDGWIADGRVQGASILVTQGPHRFARNFGTAKGTEPVFLLASITKPMTAAAVMTLVDAGQAVAG